MNKFLFFIVFSLAVLSLSAQSINGVPNQQINNLKPVTVASALQNPKGIEYGATNPTAIYKLVIQGHVTISNHLVPYLTGCGGWALNRYHGYSNDTIFSVGGSAGQNNCTVHFSIPQGGSVFCVASPDDYLQGPIGVPQGYQTPNSALFQFSNTQTGFTAHCFAATHS